MSAMRAPRGDIRFHATSESRPPFAIGRFLFYTGSHDPHRSGRTPPYPAAPAQPDRRAALPMKTLLYQQTNVAIWWDDDGWLYADWIGVQSSNNMVASCEQLLRLLQSRHASNLLIDHTRIEGVASEAAEWVGREWFPRMRHAGLQRTAWVRSPAGHGQLAAEA